MQAVASADREQLAQFTQPLHSVEVRMVQRSCAEAALVLSRLVGENLVSDI